MSKRGIKRVAFYVRVSRDDQTIHNQIVALSAEVERRGWQCVATYQDEGISGAKGRDKRPGLNAMLEAADRHEFDVLMSWALDRLGRSTIDLLQTLETLHRADVGLVLLQQPIDTTTPHGKLLYQFLSAFSEFERTMIRERTIAGLERARKAGRVGGRPKIGRDRQKAVERALRAGMSITKAAKASGVGYGTAYRVAQAMAAIETAPSSTAPSLTAPSSTTPSSTAPSSTLPS